MTTLIIALGLIGAWQNSTPAKVDTVAVVGCVKQGAKDSWTLVNATEPVVSNANAPSKKELDSLARSGKNEFQLIGVTIFNLPAHLNHQVVVKGLFIKATPIGRLNVTSVTMLSESCPGNQGGAKAPPLRAQKFGN